MPATRGGALGEGSLTDRAQPFPVGVLTSGIVAVQPGGFHTCAMTQMGAVYCWGWAEGGRLGDGTASDKLLPEPLMSLGPGSAIAISVGGTGGCALSRGGTLRCWGENGHGEAGDGTKMMRTAPVPVPDLGTSVVDVSFGGAHACALMRGGTVRCWGDNARGQLGDGTQDERTRPVLVKDLFDAVRVSAGEQHTCAVRKGGEVVCWGDNAGRQLGLPAGEAQRSFPVPVAGLAGATDVTAGGTHSCALLGASGQVQCWGANESGQLGDATTTGRSAPAPVMNLTDGLSISAGHAHTCARTRSGNRCWGNNEFGQLGDGSAMNRLTPVTPN
jgi:alpha-tubulin suppressor-like RCC1 family protein